MAKGCRVFSPTTGCPAQSLSPVIPQWDPGIHYAQARSGVGRVQAFPGASSLTWGLDKPVSHLFTCPLPTRLLSHQNLSDYLSLPGLILSGRKWRKSWQWASGLG
jgi:hypothetical protein